MSTATAQSAAQQFEYWMNYDRGTADPVSEERYYRLAMMHAAIAQAEAAEKRTEYLGRIMTALEYMATGGEQMLPALIVADEAVDLFE